MTPVQNNVMPQDLLTAMNPAKSGTSAVKDAQDRFMTLLVTQMKNQDPLNPLDNAQVTSQLAQLSTVTGIDKLNGTLEAMMTSFQSNQALQAASMIGRGVLTPGSSLAVSEGKGIFGFELQDPADKVAVTIWDGAGQVVRTLDLGAHQAGIHPMTWDGMRDNGVAASNGNYRFEITATRGGQPKSEEGLAFGVVGSVTTGTGGVTLNVPSMGGVALSAVRQIL